MPEYQADKREQKYIYKQIRKKYKRWKYGITGMLCCVEIIIAILVWLVIKTREFSADTLIVCVGMSFVPILVGGIFMAWAISGGREITLRISDRVALQTDTMVVEYTLKNTRNLQIRYRIKYSDIKAIQYSKDKKRLEISGKYYIFYRDIRNKGNSPKCVTVDEIRDNPLYIYAYYKKFEECVEEIYKRTEMIAPGYFSNGNKNTEQKGKI